MFQKKVEEKKPTILSESEIQKYKKEISNTNNSDNLSITDLSLDEILPQCINNVIICISNGLHHIMLPDNLDQQSFKTFKKSPGGILNKDVLRYTRGKDHGKYLLIKDASEKKIVRLIEDDEIYIFKNLNLVNGIIKDTPFMTLKTLDLNESLISTKTSKTETDYEVETINVSQSVVIEEDEDNSASPSSVSLFND